MNSLGLPDNISEFDRLERRFRVFYIINILAIVIFVLLDIYVIWKVFFVYKDLKTIHLAIAGLAVSMVILFFMVYRPIFRSAKIELRETEDKHIGKYSKKELIGIFGELLRPYIKKELPKLYIVKDKTPEVSVVNSIFYNFIRQLNAIFISSIVFHILKPAELKAIIGHELGHFYKYQLPSERIRGFFDVFMGIFPAYLFFVLGIGNILLWVLIFVITYILITMLLAQISMKFESTIEFLADHYSASRFGKLNLINGILSISKSQEIMEGLYVLIIEKIDKLETISPYDYDKIVEIIMTLLPKKLLSVKELQEFVDKIFESDELARFRKSAQSVNKKEKEEFVNSSLKMLRDKNNYRILDWDLFDFNKKDFKIDEVEYPFLIRSIVERPDEQMFDLYYDNSNNAKGESHPPIRDRILFLEKHFSGSEPKVVNAVAE